MKTLREAGFLGESAVPNADSEDSKQPRELNQPAADELIDRVPELKGDLGGLLEALAEAGTNRWSARKEDEGDAIPSLDPDDFEFLGVLGEGGMGTVHLASQQSIRRLVALKMLRLSLGEDPRTVGRRCWPQSQSTDGRGSGSGASMLSRSRAQLTPLSVKTSS